ncbi:MAG: FAD:protein FMN transferase [Ruminiclostridium sp.]|nr:FAD:protein FMN transferase [Ruminiclostridium sp.]
MKKFKYFFAVLILAAVSSCGAVPETEASRELFAMDTIISVKAYGQRSEEAVNAAANRLKELEDLFSVTDINSDIGKLNSLGSANVSDNTAYVISEAANVCESTDGALDITIYPVLREWGFTTGNMHVPSEEDIAAALAKTGYRDIGISGNTVTLPEGYMLDLGSCAKGYSGDEMLGVMSEYGINSALVNLGGNVQALGSKPNGTEWSVGIANPFSPNELLGVLQIHDKSVITSGGYQRYFTDDDGNVYIHILDPRTGHPADSGLVSVTVVGDRGIMCDALSTALFVMGKERAVSYWRGNGGFDMVLVTGDGTVYITEKIADSFRNSSGFPVEIIYE